MFDEFEKSQDCHKMHRKHKSKSEPFVPYVAKKTFYDSIMFNPFSASSGFSAVKDFIYLI
jgi:hypothetical protein